MTSGAASGRTAARERRTVQPDAGGLVWRWVLLATAVAQIASIPLAGFDRASLGDPVIVPPGGFFAIWSLVIAGCLATALWGLPATRATSPVYRRLHLPLTVAQVGFVVWLLVAASVPALTLPVFLAMVVALAVCLRAVVGRPTDAVTRWLVGSTVGLYAGWSTAAVWINAATLVPATTQSPPGAVGTAVQVACVAGAVVTGALGVRLSRGEPAYAAAVAYALVGVLVSSSAAGSATLVATSFLGLVAVATVVAATTRHRVRVAG